MGILSGGFLDMMRTTIEATSPLFLIHVLLLGWLGHCTGNDEQSSIGWPFVACIILCFLIAFFMLLLLGGNTLVGLLHVP